MLWHVLWLLALTAIINYLVLRFGFDGLSYRLTAGNKDYEIGEEIPIASVIENNKLLAVSYLKVEEFLPADFNVSKNIYSLFIMPLQRVKRTYKIRAEKRGLHRISEAVLELGDFVGFKSAQKTIAMQEEIVVLPKKIELAESISPLGPLSGEISVRRWIIDDPLMTIGIREYSGNEPQRFIHWPSTLKHGNLMVKSFDFTSDNSVLVVLNVERPRDNWHAIEEEIIDTAVSLARGVLEEFQEQGIPYGLATNAYNEPSRGWGHYHHAGLGANHLSDLLHTLGSIHFKVPDAFANTLRDLGRRKGNYTTVVIVTPQIMEPYLESIDLLAKTVPRTVVITVEDENLASLSQSIMKYRYTNHA